MTRGIFTLLCAGIFAVLCYVNLLVNRPRIEQDLTARTFLAAAGRVELLDVKFEGRDGVVAVDEAGRDKQIAREVAEATWGVREVKIITRKVVKPELGAIRLGPELTLSGRLPTEEIKHAVEVAASRQFGSGNVKGSVDVDSSAARREYLSGLTGYLALMKEAPGDLKLELREDTLTLAGEFPDAAAIAPFEARARERLPKGLSLVCLLTASVPRAVAETPVKAKGDLFQEALAALSFLFGFNSVEVVPQSQEALAQAARLLRENPGRKVQVLGYTDAIGSDAYNVRLAGRRSSSVIRQLANAGVDVRTLEPVARGKRDYVADNGTIEGRARNRRVQLLARPTTAGGGG